MGVRGRSRFLLFSTYILSFVGILLSLYAYYVETSAEKDKSFKAMCDFSESVSCSKVFTSRYGRGFGLLQYIVGHDSPLNQPNSVFGMMFYLMQIVCASSVLPMLTTVQIITGVMANFGSVYLAYILYFILEDFCVVCVSTYVVNAFILACACLKQRNYNSAQKTKRKHKQS
ncbi:vitamin K epoxide reductase complex subunit 1-like protein 1 [Mizuhopecten yessoensis]|uniref:vitamin K epoxide reductase complex subunit 1-like protein 1 n=1 Tax=Mizuhopecten yessoensis TaxID=6573 RepID=UPI000B45C409|nr:vitamin K epoxide reductase complex subunit 1-like protein 1 [Mizuhopecten yessoensis]